MSGTNSNANDSMIRRLEVELREAETFCNGVIERANAGERDLEEGERNMLSEKRGRMSSIKDQIEQLEDISRVATEVAQRARVVDTAITSARGKATPLTVEYRSAGAYVMDMYRAALGHREPKERLEVYLREAAHQTTSDLEGIIPEPVVGEVINSIDAARPIVSALGVKPLPSASWKRPRVTQHTAVGTQVAEKTELTSQKMIIDSLTVDATTIGGYVNVSRQSIDFAQPAVLDTIIGDLAAQYAVETEAKTADAIMAVATTPIEYADTDAGLVGALWAAAAAAYNAMRGQGGLVLLLSPGRLATFGRLFAPINPQNAQSTGFTAASFGQGPMGQIAGIPAIMSAGLSGTEAAVVSTKAVEVYEQRVGTLQAVEPSVMGVQVAYAGYYANLVVNAAGVQPLAPAA